VAAPAPSPNAAAASLKAAAALAAPLKAAAALLKAAAIDVSCHSWTAPDVDAPATGGLLVPMTNKLLPPRFLRTSLQVDGTVMLCGGLPPRCALLRSLSHSFATSQSNAPAITGEIKVPRRWRRRREARVVKPAVASHRLNRDRATGSDDDMKRPTYFRRLFYQRDHWQSSGWSYRCQERSLAIVIPIRLVSVWHGSSAFHRRYISEFKFSIHHR
jgi:hypothetical protein